MTPELMNYGTNELTHLLDRFVTYLVAERDASPYTVKNYQHEIREFIDFCREQDVTRLDQIDRHLLRLYLTKLSANKIARASIARRLSELRSFGKYLVRTGVAKANPFLAVNSPRLE